MATNIETVPVSGRKRFNCISPETEAELGKQQYEEVLRQYKGSILPASRPEVRMVKKVLDRLVPNSGVEGDWEVFVVQSEEANAFVIPGGKVFVMSGILPICEGEGGLAAVLGHEIAHNVAHHSAENVSRVSVLLPIAWLAGFLLDVSGNLPFFVLDLALNRPGSRKQETEADFIGLSMALSLWVRLLLIEGSDGCSELL